MPTSPTDAELEILHILWDQGPSTVREVHNAQVESKDVGYATTVKMLAIMFQKGLVKRDDSVRPQIYRAGVSRASTQRGLLNNLMTKAYQGSARSLVQHLLTSRKATAEELRAIRELIDDLTGGEA